MSTQKIVTTTAVKKLGEQIEFYNCTVPDPKATEIYDASNINISRSKGEKSVLRKFTLPTI